MRDDDGGLVVRDGVVGIVRVMARLPSRLGRWAAGVGVGVVVVVVPVIVRGRVGERGVGVAVRVRVPVTEVGVEGEVRGQPGALEHQSERSDERDRRPPTGLHHAARQWS